MPERLGRYTLRLERPAGVLGFAAVAGKKEGEGPLGAAFDRVYPDADLGEASWEKAEARMQGDALRTALDKAGLSPAQLDCVLAGDLLNQCISSTFGLREFGVPFLGQYGACSTMAQALGLAALLVECGAAGRCAAVTSSHFCTAERQFRTPLEYGGQRAPTAQWTVTGAGAALLGPGGAPRVQAVTFGRMRDLGVKDASNMGAAMAPAAAQTLCDFWRDTGTGPQEYDLILTGDLGAVGSALLRDLLRREGLDPGGRLQDCGLWIFDRAAQDVHAGGSGCGCSAAVLCSAVLQGMQAGRWRRVLFCGTGALMSPTSSQQGESIPGIAHAVLLEARGD